MSFQLKGHSMLHIVAIKEGDRRQRSNKYRILFKYGGQSNNLQESDK
jgi:hypothetical protein